MMREGVGLIDVPKGGRRVFDYYHLPSEQTAWAAPYRSREGKLRVELYGELAALINLANEHPRSGGTGAQVTLVAGARNLLYRTRTEWRRRIKRPLLQPVV